MAESVSRKRKRSGQDTGGEGLPRKSRVADEEGEEKSDGGAVLPSGKKDGLSRQVKSERRSKKSQGRQPRPASDRDTGQTENRPTAGTTSKTPEVAHAPDETSKNEKPSAVRQHQADPASKPSTHRFILFIGNLPYTATTTQIQSHFGSLGLPSTSIRHRTDKSTGRSKGFCFIEFEDYSKMKTCLKLYHHSIFDPERNAGADAPTSDNKASRKGRKINVELTVGGGGKGKDRKEKLKGKNARLEEQRDRARAKDVEARQKEKGEKDKAQAKKAGTDANATALGEAKMPTAPLDGRGDIHPSRMGRVATR